MKENSEHHISVGSIALPECPSAKFNTISNIHKRGGGELRSVICQNNTNNFPRQVTSGKTLICVAPQNSPCCCSWTLVCCPYCPWSASSASWRPGPQGLLGSGRTCFDLSHSVTKILHSTRSIVFKTFPISVCKVMIQCDDCLGPVQWLYII